MAGKSKGGNTVNTVWKIAQPIAEKLGLVLWNVKFVKEGASWFLRIFIDKDGGVGIDDCTAMSHALDGPLDEADPIEQSYCLEVSSPGVERELSLDFHFEKMTGLPVKIQMIRPVDGRKKFSGRLKTYNDGIVTIIDKDNNEININKKETAHIRLDDFGGFDE